MKILPSRSDLMRGVRRENTTPEMVVRSVAHSLGYRFRLHRKELPGSPDIVFVKQRVAPFVHGCFWHRHQDCRRTTVPKTNTEFWSVKFAANVKRDKRATRELTNMNWRCLVIWECETRDSRLVAQILTAALSGHSVATGYTS